MKNSTILFLVLFFANSLFAQRIADLPENKAAKPAQPVLQEQQVQPVQTASQDSIIFDKLVHDYGTITQGADGNCVFTFTNKGKAPIVLSNVKASCGCTTPEWTKEPVAPGKTGEIKVSYNTNLAGAFNKTITVTSNAVNSSVVLRIKGNVTPKQ